MEEPLEGMAGGELEDDSQQCRFLGRSKLRYILAPLPMMSCKNASAGLTTGRHKEQHLLQIGDEDPSTVCATCSARTTCASNRLS